MNAAAEIYHHPDSMLAEALRLARLGIPVFPVFPDTKKPTTEHGFKEATTDEAQISKWWTWYPLNMIGVRTGAASGLAVLDLDLDIDPKTGEVIDGSATLQNVMDRNGWTLPDTVEARTPRGGRHLYFKHEEGFRSRQHKPQGIDYRAEGGYIIHPPSKRDDGKGYFFENPPPLFEYAEAPDWLGDFFRHDVLHGLFEKPILQRSKEEAHDCSETSSRPEDIERALDDYWDADDYDDWWKAAMALHTVPDGKKMWLAWAAKSPKFKAEENETKWTRTKPDRGLTVKTILGRVPRNVLSEWGKEHSATSQLDDTLRRLTVGTKKSDDQATEAQREAGGGNANDLILNSKGNPIACLANVLTLLRSVPDWQGVMALDRMAAKVALLAPIPDAEGRKPNAFKPRQLIDGDIVKAAEWVQRRGLIGVGKETVGDAINLVAEERGFDPLEDKLRSLVWDGLPRIENWLLDYCGAEVTATQPEAYIKAVGRCWLISAAARALRPGCKVDSALVLVGPQGIGKSTAGRILGYEWFSDSLPPVHSKDASDHLRGAWLLEIGEMATATRADVEELKAFLSRTTERFRPPYGRCEIEYPRRCVFMGTSNKDAFLRDETGNRRFWPVTVTRIDIKRLEADRDQLWAEAVNAFDKGKQWHLTAEEADIATVQQAAFVITDEREQTLARRLAGRQAVTSIECLDLLEMYHDKKDQMAVAAMLRSLGWTRKSDGKRKFWAAPLTTSSDPRWSVPTDDAPDFG